MSVIEEIQELCLEFQVRAAGARDLDALGVLVVELVARRPVLCRLGLYVASPPLWRVERLAGLGLAATPGADAADAALPGELDACMAERTLIHLGPPDPRTVGVAAVPCVRRWLLPLAVGELSLGALELGCAVRVARGPAIERWLLHLGRLLGSAIQDLVAARELRRQEIELRSITCSATEAIILADGEGRITFWNWAAENLFGYPQGEALGKDLHRLLAPDDYLEAHVEGFRRFKATGEGVKIGQVAELLARRRDGVEIPVEISVTAVDGPEGLLMVGIVRDVSERWRVSSELRASEARYRAIVQDQTELICRYRPDGTLTFVNDAYCRYFGQDPADLLGQLWGPEIPEEDQRRLDEQIQRLGPDQPTATLEHRVLDTRGVRWLQWTDRAIFDEHGLVREYQAVGRDITSQREAEGELLQAREDLELRVEERTLELSRANEALLREVGQRRRAERALRRHREQLRSMSSQLSLAEERERRRIATAVHDDIGQSLALSRLKLAALGSRVPDQAGSLAEIAGLLDGAIHNTRTLTFELSTPILYDLGLVAAVEWLCEQNEAQHGLRFSLSADCPAQALGTDLRVLLFRTLRELLHNVIKHARAREVRVGIDHAPGRIRVVVEDDGVGFPPAPPSGRRSGFGLFAIRERVTALGGSFTIGGRRGGGARVSLSIPLTPGDAGSGVPT